MKLLRYYRTLKYLKPIQIFGRIYYKFYSPKLNTKPHPSTRVIINPWIPAITKNNHYVANNQFNFLNDTRDISSPTSWNDTKASKLWLYNLHYFDDLNSELAPELKQLHHDLIIRWIAENPFADGCGWEPYPISLRIVNWIKWFLQGNTRTEIILQSLAEQTRFLSKRLEKHLLGNHLFTNAKALIFAGCFFAGAEAKQWLKTGLIILKQELNEQILNDGGHFERSPMYHNIILEDILDLRNLLNTYQIITDINWQQIATSMLSWSQGLTHPDGEIAFFNDATLNNAPSFMWLNQYADRLGFNFQVEKKAPLLRFDASGFYRLQYDNASLLVDAGSVGPRYLPGHAHAETLSFEFSLDKKRILVNSGISTYACTPERFYQRSTAAHNALVVDDKNSSEIWSSFRVGRRAQIIQRDMETQHNFTTLTATHNGYRYLSDRVLHTRRWRMQQHKLIIEDILQGEQEHEIYLPLHVHPLLKVKSVDSKFVIDEENIHINFSNNVQLSLESGYYYPEFGKIQLSQIICARTKSRLPITILTEINW